jgi:lysophospholipase L1-like esterase
MGDANADWLAYGLEEALAEKPEIGIVRKHRTDSGLIRYDQRRDSGWPQVAREIIAAEKPKFVIMMIGSNDRQSIREKAPPAAPANAQPTQPPPAVPPPPPDLERQAVQQQHPRPTSAQPRQADYGPWEFQSEKWELAYIKRIDATITALKSAGGPVIWVGLPSQRGTNASNDSSYLNELYRSQAEKAGIVYVDIWDGFVDEAGKFSPQGPDYLGQTRRLRTSDGVYFTKFGARKLAHYVERDIERIIGNKGMPVALPVPVGSSPQVPDSKGGGPAQRPAAGPVVPLTETRVAPEELLGGGGATPVRALTKGEPLAAPSGRADDFSWPRGALSEAAAPDTAAPDAGAKSTSQRKSAMDAYATQTAREQKPAQHRSRPRP